MRVVKKHFILKSYNRKASNKHLIFGKTFMKKAILFFAITLFLSTFSFAQTQEKPFTQTEFVQVLYKIQKTPSLKTEIAEEIRVRGIGFPLTEGLRGLIKSKTANDADFKRTVEEAERRRSNPTASQLPEIKEANELLEKARENSLVALEEMPDFVVKQLVTRSAAYAGTNNFRRLDKLIVGVSYRADGYEEYKVLNIDGIPQLDKKEKRSYEEVGGTSSTGEFVTVLSSIFKAESKAKFEAIDTDLIRNRRTIVYSFEVKKENSQQTLTSAGAIINSTISGYKGKIWVDRENARVLRVESIATEIPSDFPIRAASRLIDYEWVTIGDQKYLLPLASDVRLTSKYDRNLYETRNQINFKNYQKYGAEVKVLDEDLSEEELKKLELEQKKKPPINF